jgi:hypothetical protein
MQIYIYYCNVNSSTSYKVCSVQRIEVVLTTRRNFVNRTVGIVMDCIIECGGCLILIVLAGIRSMVSEHSSYVTSIMDSTIGHASTD